MPAPHPLGTLAPRMPLGSIGMRMVQPLAALALGAGAFIAVNVAITALAMTLRGLAKKAIEITVKNLIKKPFISLINLFRKGAGASLMQGGMRNLPPPPLSISSFIELNKSLRSNGCSW